MAGGGSSELFELRKMVDEEITELKMDVRDLEERIQVLENLLPMDPLPGGGGTSGGSSGSKKKKSAGAATKAGRSGKKK